MHECAAPLVLKYRPQEPGDGDTGGQVTFGRGEGVRGSGGFEEEKREESEDLGPDASVVVKRVHAKRGERGQDNEDSGPAVVEREREVNEYFVGGAGRLMILLDDIVNVSDG